MAKKRLLNLSRTTSVVRSQEPPSRANPSPRLTELLWFSTLSRFSGHILIDQSGDACDWLRERCNRSTFSLKLPYSSPQYGQSDWFVRSLAYEFWKCVNVQLHAQLAYLLQKQMNWVSSMFRVHGWASGCKHRKATWCSCDFSKEYVLNWLLPR